MSKKKVQKCHNPFFNETLQVLNDNAKQCHFCEDNAQYPQCEWLVMIRIKCKVFHLFIQLYNDVGYPLADSFEFLCSCLTWTQRSLVWMSYHLITFIMTRKKYTKICCPVTSVVCFHAGWCVPISKIGWQPLHEQLPLVIL